MTISLEPLVAGAVEHIRRVVSLDRVMCSEGYDGALAYVAENLRCPREWMHWDVYPPAESFWGWRVPPNLPHWRDGRADRRIAIPNDRPMKALQVRVPGTTDAEIVFVTHACHPAPGANDNASGLAMLMELIRYYTLHPPRFSLRFLFTVEYWGTVAFCARHEAELSGMIAGVSVDMVGADQDLCGSTMVVDEIPDHLASCLDLAFWHHMQIAARVGHYRLIGNPLTAFRCNFAYHMGGSDHYVLNDSSVAIPSTALGTDPDRFYHTPDDTIDKISPDTLRLFFTTIVEGLETFSDVSERGHHRLAQLVLHRYDEVIHALMVDAVGPGDVGADEAAFRIAHTYRHAAARLASLTKTHSAGTIKPWLELLDDCFAQTRRTFAVCRGRTLEVPELTDTVRYRKRFKGPLSLDRMRERLSVAERAFVAKHAADDRLFFQKVDAALNYASQRSLAETAWLLRLHYGGVSYTETLRSFFEILCGHELLEVVRV